MTRWHAAIVAGLVGLMLIGAAAANQLAYPGDIPSDRVIRAQKKAEKAFEAGDYDRAMWFYRKELAPIGDKYSQYMIGHMYANGLGVARNVVRAAAWFQVAAERGHEGIIETSEAFQQQLSPEQLTAASQTAERLREELGDIALLKREIRRDLDRLRDVTGTRTASCDARPGTVFLPFALQRQFPVSRYCEILNARIDERVAYIQGYVTYGPLELLPDEEDEAETEE
ncbi:MAG: hypothetical protein AAF229_10220 [Pseudomonadota bacterium]